jgi:hypothetical protein
MGQCTSTNGGACQTSANLNNPTSEIMNTEYTTAQTAAIETAAAAITAAATASLVAIVQAKASIASVIREQVAILTKAKIADKDIAALVKESVGNACVPSTISRTLTECGIRLRGKRNDSGVLKSADALLTAALQPKPEKITADAADEDGEEGGEEVECIVEDGTKHTAETLAALLASIDPEIVEEALAIAGLA